MSKQVHIIAVDNDFCSEKAWNALLRKIPKEDKIVVAHGEKYEAQVWIPTSLHHVKETEYNNTELILGKFKEKCKESGRDCSFRRLAHHTGPAILATQLCQLAQVEGAKDVWLGSEKMSTENPSSIHNSVSAAVSKICPCSVHIVKEDIPVSSGPGFFATVLHKIDQMREVPNMAKQQ